MFLVFNASGQQWLPDFKHYTPRDGLPSSEIYQITGDAQNNIWFATDRGAVRYDGYSFRTYDIRDSLPDNSVIKLYKDYQGRIWFISLSSVLSYYKDGKIVPYKYNNLIPSYFNKSIITSIFVDSLENVHLNSIEGDLYTITSKGHLIRHKKDSVTNSYIINSTGHSVSTFNLTSGKNFTTTFKVQSLRDTFSFTLPERIRYSNFATLKLSNGDLIFNCDRNLIRIRPDGSYKIKLMDMPVLNVFEDGDSSIWVSTYLDGVYLCDRDLNIRSHYLKNFSVSYVYGDFEGGLWFSTLENGIFYLTSKNNLSLAIGEDYFQDKVTDLASSGDSVLFFTSSKGLLYKINSRSGSLDVIDIKKSINSDIKSINSVYYDADKADLVLCVTISLNDENIKTYTKEWKGYNVIVVPSLVKLLPRDNDVFLGSSYSSLFEYNKERNLIQPIFGKFTRATVIFEDSYNRVFAGSLDGLHVLKDSSFIPVDSSNELLRSRITCINELKNNILVIGTRSNGILIYKDKILKNIIADDGLTSDNINCLTVEDSVIWAGTNRGISRITVTNQFPFTFTVDRINISNGLVSDELNAITLGNGLVYTATNGGLNLLDKNQLKLRNDEFPLYISAVRINERDTAVNASYSLNHKQNNIGIAFTALSFRNSKQIKYTYRLIGLDTTWRTTLNRDVQFSGLGSGTYTFQLMGYNENGTNSGKPVGIKFSIDTSVYETTGFRYTVGVILLMALYAGVQYRIKTIQKKADEKNALNKKFSELNLNALRSQMNPHFTFNVLNSIKYYIANKDPESAQFYISKFAKLIRMILDQSRTEFISLSDEIRMLQLYMELEELRFENKFTYSVNTDDNLNTEMIFIPGMLIQPFVENSIKHGIRYKKGEAKVQLNFSSSGSVLICTITDNGIGREEAAKRKSSVEEYKSMGTAIVNERIEALSILFNGNLKNYTYDLKDEHGKPAGTCVSIEIPFRNTPL